MNDQRLYEDISTLQNNFQVKIKQNVYYKDADGEHVSLHWHEHLEILHFTRGSCCVVCAGESFFVKAGDTVVINTNELHYTKKDGDAEFFCIHIAPAFFSDVHFSDVLLRTYIKNDKPICDFAKQMYSEYQNQSEGFDIKIKGIAYMLMAHLVRNYKMDALSDNELMLRKNRLSRMGDILTFISENYQTKITTSSLAEHFHLTEHYFCALFKKETGQSPLSYINRYRTQKAAIMLKNTDRSITEIALGTGFEDSNYFARCFKKHFGISARQYRRQV